MTVLGARSWCAKVRFGTPKPFLFGTVSIDNRETGEVVRTAILFAAASHFPAVPQILAIIPGEIYFRGEEDSQEMGTE